MTYKCKNADEDEFHVLFICPIYEETRLNIMPNNLLCVRNVYSMCRLMSEDMYQKCVARYLVAMFTKRNNLLE